jgi:hypothetical protein
MITPPVWYKPVENWLAPQWPVMIAIALGLALVSGYLIWKRNPLAMALWLTYLIMP